MARVQPEGVSIRDLRGASPIYTPSEADLIAAWHREKRRSYAGRRIASLDEYRDWLRSIHIRGMRAFLHNRLDRDESDSIVLDTPHFCIRLVAGVMGAETVLASYRWRGAVDVPNWYTMPLDSLPWLHYRSSQLAIWVDFLDHGGDPLMLREVLSEMGLWYNNGTTVHMMLDLDGDNGSERAWTLQEQLGRVHLSQLTDCDMARLRALGRLRLTRAQQAKGLLSALLKSVTLPAMSRAFGIKQLPWTLIKHALHSARTGVGDVSWIDFVWMMPLLLFITLACSVGSALLALAATLGNVLAVFCTPIGLSFLLFIKIMNKAGDETLNDDFDNVDSVLESLNTCASVEARLRAVAQACRRGISDEKDWPDALYGVILALLPEYLREVDSSIAGDLDRTLAIMVCHHLLYGAGFRGISKPIAGLCNPALCCDANTVVVDWGLCIDVAPMFFPVMSDGSGSLFDIKRDFCAVYQVLRDSMRDDEGRVVVRLMRPITLLRCGYFVEYAGKVGLIRPSVSPGSIAHGEGAGPITTPAAPLRSPNSE